VLVLLSDVLCLSTIVTLTQESLLHICTWCLVGVRSPLATVWPMIGLYAGSHTVTHSVHMNTCAQAEPLSQKLSCLLTLSVPFLDIEWTERSLIDELHGCQLLHSVLGAPLNPVVVAAP